jgi:homoserine dehydrogenase
MLESEFLGQSLFIGRGAGARPTATAVVGDIVDIATGMLQNKEFSASRYTMSNQYQILPSGETRSRFYLRLATAERAGILARVTKILSDQDISISAITQEEGTVEGPIPIVILTRLAREENVRQAVAAIDAMDFTRAPTVVLHVEDITL